VLLDGEEVVHAPSRGAQNDAQALKSLRYWWGAREMLLERLAYDAAQRAALEERLKPLEAWLADPANEGHPRYWEADGRRQSLENWALTYSKSWIRMSEHHIQQTDEIATGIAARLSDEGRQECRLIGWSDEVCRGTPF
jgi:hypothetical protein